MPTLVSPLNLHKAACKEMLSGRDPITHNDWVLVVNFWAANVSHEVQPAAITLMGMIMECPLTEQELEAISLFQTTH
jgi:hypothetical protein